MIRTIAESEIAVSERKLASVLASSFEQDPLAVHVFPNDIVRERHLLAIYRVYLREFARRGRVWVNDQQSAAALWMPPGRHPLTWTRQLRLLPAILWAAGPTRFPAAARVMSHLDRMTPTTGAFWYLGVLGVDPACQRRGIGSALLEHGLRTCDQVGVAVYLETAEPSTLKFYARFGFSVLKESPLDDGPAIWGLWRDAKPSRMSAGLT